MFDINEISRILPHKYPFLLVDRVDSMVAGESIEGYKTSPFQTTYFKAIFRGTPIYPAVLIIEGDGSGWRCFGI